MTHIRPFSRHQRTAALVAEGICLLPPLLTALWSLWRLPQPPPLSPFPAAAVARSGLLSLMRRTALILAHRPAASDLRRRLALAAVVAARRRSGSRRAAVGTSVGLR